MNLVFTYGSLMCIDIMQSVAGNVVAIGKASLFGYKRVTVKNEHYPAIVESKKNVTQGIVYTDISKEGLRNLDEFEGDWYERKAVWVKLMDGRTIECWVYVFKRQVHHLLEESLWDFEAFLKNGKTDFIKKYVGFSKI